MGFDEVRFVWSKGSECEGKFKEGLLENKRTQRIEDLEPSSWFKEKWTAWEKQLAEWQQIHKDAKDGKRKPAPKQEEKKDAESTNEGKEGEDKKEEVSEEKKEEEKKEDAEIDEDDINVYTHEDVNDIGNGKPLFGNFAYEDWTLLSLRYELHLLVHAFAHDVADPDRQSFHESHLLFYFNKYFGKSIEYKLMGLEDFAGLCGLIKDSMTLNDKSKFLDVVMPEDAPLDKFVRHTENHRRERQQCVDAGDESALLKFTEPPKPQRGGDRYGYDRGGYRGRSSGGGGNYRDQRDQQWDRSKDQSWRGGGSGGGSDRNAGWGGSSSYSDRRGQEKRSYEQSSRNDSSKYSRSDNYGSSSGKGSRGYERS